MKKVLVTGASGCLGKLVLKYLLSEGKYDITALDLKNRKTYKALKKYNKRINIIYGDVCDPLLIDDLVKENDYIIHLASVAPSISILNEKVSQEIDYKGCENIVRAITFYNPKCFLIYPSTTNIYGNSNTSVTTSTKNKSKEIDFYTKCKIDCEQLIKEKLDNYVIYRIPQVLGNLKHENFTYNAIMNKETEFIVDSDAAYALVRTIDFKDKVNKKVYNLGGGTTCVAPFSYVTKNILKIHGMNFKYIWAKIFLDKVFYGNTYNDSKKINDILNYQSQSIDSYFMYLKRNDKFRGVNRLLAKPFTIKKDNR